MGGRGGAGADGGWEHFQHDADIGVRGWGRTLAAALEQAALALTAVVVDPSTVEARELVELSLREPDPELLLVDWLNELIYLMATRRMLFATFEVQLDGERLQAKAWGEPVEPARHRPAVEVKGATYTALAVRRGDDGGWQAQCVVDV